MVALNHLKGKKIGVFGLGKAGKATIDALLAGGAEVYAADDKAESLNNLPQNVSRAPFAEWQWKDLAMLVLAPGVPLTHPEPHAVVKKAKQENCPIMGDIELLMTACADARTIGITGTNGKSTTTALIGHILKEAGKITEVGGNLGTACLSLKALTQEGTYVLELSSYQLDLLHHTRFNIACWLNITPDHLDRHGGMEGYVAAKKAIFARQQIGDVAVIGVDDTYSEAVARELIADKTRQVIPVSVKGKVQQGVYVEKGQLHDAFSGATEVLDLTILPRLRGNHNWQNVAIAYAACRATGLPSEMIWKAVRSFEGLPHRMEWVAEKDGVLYINDSKATNADSTEKALAAYDTIYWIVGGKSKAGGITSLAYYFPKVAHAFLVGESENEFAGTLDAAGVNYTRCGKLENAINEASAMAQRDKKPGAVVLLSPAAASFDQWPHFEARGDAFRVQVQQMTSGKEAAAL